MKTRLLPKVKYVNFRKEFGVVGARSFSSWFSIRRYWGGRVIFIGVKHQCIHLDFRANWIADMTEGL